VDIEHASQTFAAELKRMRKICALAVDPRFWDQLDHRDVSSPSHRRHCRVADTLLTHRIPAALAVEAASETIAACARQGYRETAVVLDADGATIVTLRGDGAGIHTLDSAHDKAYTSVSFKNDTLALAERASLLRL
jgi:hypothetical protein